MERCTACLGTGYANPEAATDSCPVCGGAGWTDITDYAAWGIEPDDEDTD
jgi:DnaJ-class molecular chaperone